MRRYHNMKRLMISALMAMLVHGAACMAQTENQPSYDVNKDVRNTTDYPAYGFKIVLRGTPVLFSHYDGIPHQRGFHTFDHPVVSAAEGQTTVLYWSDPVNTAGMPEPIPHLEWVHVGYRLDRCAEILEAYWTDQDGGLIPGGKVNQVPQIFTWVGRDFRITLKNTLRDRSPVTVEVSGYRLWEGRMGLENLNGSNPEMNTGFYPVPDAEGEITLGPGESKTLQFSIPPSLAARDKPPSLFLKKGKQGVFIDYAQFYPANWPSVPPQPAVSQGGLILMVMLVLGTGAIVIARRTRHTTA
jgi:hypothetical protein